MIKAVDGVDLEVMEGETFGLLGPNGAGKTATIRMLNCTISPTFGSAMMAGHDIITQKDRVNPFSYRWIVPFSSILRDCQGP